MCREVSRVCGNMSRNENVKAVVNWITLFFHGGKKRPYSKKDKNESYDMYSHENIMGSFTPILC